MSDNLKGNYRYLIFKSVTDHHVLNDQNCKCYEDSWIEWTESFSEFIMHMSILGLDKKDVFIDHDDYSNDEIQQIQKALIDSYSDI